MAEILDEEHPAQATIPYTYQELEQQAKANLPKEVFDYVAMGSGTEFTLRKNVETFDHLSFRPEVV